MKLNEEQKKELKEQFLKVIEEYKGHPEFAYILLDMMKLHSSKSNDYATDESPFSNIELCEKANFPAWKGVIIRLGDKYSRLLNALSGKLFKHEGVEDAFMDNACYSIIGLIEYKKVNNEKRA